MPQNKQQIYFNVSDLKSPSLERVAGCPSDAERLSSGVCLAFLSSCPLGCSRCHYRYVFEIKYECFFPGGAQWRSVNTLEVSSPTPSAFKSSLNCSSSAQSKSIMSSSHFLQEIQHLILVDWRDGFQEGVWPILLGTKRSDTVRRRGALGERDFWAEFQSRR